MNRTTLTTTMIATLLVASPALGDDREKIAREAERRAKLFFAARRARRIFKTELRETQGTKTVLVDKKVQIGGRWVRRKVEEQRRTTVYLYHKEINERGLEKAWSYYLLPSVLERIDTENLAEIVGIDVGREAQLLEQVKRAGLTRSGGELRDYATEARAELEAYRATCWPLAFEDVKHVRTLVSRSSVTMWHRASEVRIAVQVSPYPGAKVSIVESEDKKDDKLLEVRPSTEVMTVWVRKGGEFYLSASLEEVPHRSRGGLVLRAMECEVLREGAGMTADELVAQSLDGAGDNLEFGQVSDFGTLQLVDGRRRDLGGGSGRSEQALPPPRSRFDWAWQAAPGGGGRLQREGPGENQRKRRAFRRDRVGRCDAGLGPSPGPSMIQPGP